MRTMPPDDQIAGEGNISLENYSSESMQMKS